MRYFRELVPSMFQRRMIALMLCFPLAFLPAVVQLGRLTIAEHERHAADADAKLRRTSSAPTIRGRILDRKGRVLAEAAATYEARVDYRVMDGSWARASAASYARRQHGRDGVSAQMIDAYTRAYQAHADAMLVRIAEATGEDPRAIRGRVERIVERVESMHEQLTERRVEQGFREARSEGRELTDERRRRIRRLASQPIAEQRSRHAVARSIDDETAFALSRRASLKTRVFPAGPDAPGDDVDRFPTLEIFDTSARRYPHERQSIEIDLATLPGPLREEGVATFVVEGADTPITGWLRHGPRDTDAERRREELALDPALHDLATAGSGDDRGRYRPADAVGASGAESLFETRLRGLRGQRVHHLDSGEIDELPPLPGRDVMLTIDAKLQASVLAAMSPELGLAVVQPWHANASETMPNGTAIHGGAVVLDIETGEILAMVSTPTYTRDEAIRHPETALLDDATTPWVHKAVAKPYPPGSVAKAVVYCAAHSRGVYTLGECISCTGEFGHSQTGRPRCWIYKRFDTTHDDFLGHEPDGTEALMVSCNIFFAELGYRLGPSGMAWAYRAFGVGEMFDLGLGYEVAGLLGPNNQPDKLIMGDAIQMGIGQGPIAWTPLHAADALATIARAGARVRPHIVRSVGASYRRASIPLHPEICRQTLAGLELAVTDRRGTGHHILFVDEEGERVEQPIFNVEGVRLWGKTGTATAPPLVADPDGAGPLQPQVLRSGDHSWFVVLAGIDRPRYAVAVLMEYAGSGGKVSGPVCNQIVHALKREGYFGRP